MRKILILLFVSWTSLNAFSQNCRGLERELEGYFDSYKTGEMVDLELIDELSSKCEYPSAKFSMLYYYFLAVDAYHSNYLDDIEAYDESRAYYEKCASFYEEFDWQSRSRFLETFYTRAEGLEVVLTDLAYDLGIEFRGRYIQSAVRGYGGSSWKKTNIIRLAEVVDSTRLNQREEEEVAGNFVKSYRDGKYYKKYPNFQPKPTYDSEGEPYGYVGNISAVNPIGYLKFLGSTQKSDRSKYLYTYSDEREAALMASTQSRVARGNYRYNNYRSQQDPNDDWNLVGLRDRIELMDEPGATSSSGEYLGFGEFAYRIPSQSPVVSGGKSYLQVEVAGGERGWIPSEAIVEKGEIAVLLENTRGIPRLNMRNNDRNAVLFKAGELVVLQDYKDGMVKASSRNGTKSAWIQDIGNVSIEEQDIQIARLLHAALSNYSNRDLRSQLEAIKFVPGYKESPLSRIVEDNIRYLGN